MKSFHKYYTIFLYVLFTFISCTNSKINYEDTYQSSHEAQTESLAQTPLSCHDLPTQFSSYTEAQNSVAQASFQIKESIITDKSSWIRGATYYSCDGRTGYFLLVTDKKDYIFQGMPLEVWEGFKSAGSFGQYYNTFIRGRYFMSVGQ